jgi:hypothetical protein
MNNEIKLDIVSQIMQLLVYSNLLVNLRVRHVLTKAQHKQISLHWPPWARERPVLSSVQVGLSSQLTAKSSIRDLGFLLGSR